MEKKEKMKEGEEVKGSFVTVVITTTDEGDDNIPVGTTQSACKVFTSVVPHLDGTLMSIQYLEVALSDVARTDLQGCHKDDSGSSSSRSSNSNYNMTLVTHATAAPLSIRTTSPSSASSTAAVVARGGRAPPSRSMRLRSSSSDNSEVSDSACAACPGCGRTEGPISG